MNLCAKDIITEVYSARYSVFFIIVDKQNTQKGGEREGEKNDNSLQLEDIFDEDVFFLTKHLFIEKL